MAASATISAMILLPSSSPPSERSRSNSVHSPSARKLLFSGLLLVSSPNSRRITTVAAEKSNTGSYNGSLTQHTSFSEQFSRFTKSVLNFANSNFLPLALISAVTIGMVNPALGCQAHKYSLSKFATFGIFFIAGLRLKGEEVEAVAETWPLGLFGLASILLLGPLMAMLILRVQFAPQEFVTGLALFCCVPTTLTSGVALTQLVGGNSALALTMTVISNLLGILTVPFWVSKLLADGFGVSIPVRQLLWNLTLMLLVPLLLGKLAEYHYDFSFTGGPK
ncbi:Probable sodium/metabolite cotransporter BASS4, chloroplastic [Linum grandiflorum]